MADQQPTRHRRRFLRWQFSSRRSANPPPRWFWLVGSSLFFLLGCVFLYVLTIRPLWNVARASEWVATPCTIVSSKLNVDTSADGSTYSVDVAYRYTYAGREYEGTRYDFVSISSNTSVAAKKRIVESHAPGTRATCYVNPDDPAESVINPGLRPEMWWGLFPIPFVLVGTCGLLFGVGIWRWLLLLSGKAAEATPPHLPGTHRSSDAPP
jgi:hypothetical protein